MPQVQINDEVYELLRERAEQQGFDTADEYVLGQVADKVRREQDDASDGDQVSEEDEAKVKDRLRDLGYLD